MKPYNYQIVILSYNHPDLTAKTVQSVIDLHFPQDQICLVHNGSEAKNVQSLQTHYPLIEHLIIKENKGYTAGANFGLRQAFLKDQHVLFLTNDTEALCLPDLFPEKMDLFSILIFKRNSQVVDSISGLVNLRTGALSHVRGVADLKSNKYLKSYIPGTAFGITDQAFKVLNGFDESYHTYWDDVDLSLRAHQSNLTVGYDLRFQVKHKIGKTCHKHRFYTLYLFQRNKKRFLNLYSESRLSYLFHYLGMLRLFFKILTQTPRKKNLHLWWKALLDQNI